MTEHQEPLSQFSLHHGKVAKLFLSTNALTRKKETVAWTKPSRLHPEHGHSAKNVTTDGEPGHVGFQCLTITARYPGSVCMRAQKQKKPCPQEQAKGLRKRARLQSRADYPTAMPQQFAMLAHSPNPPQLAKLCWKIGDGPLSVRSIFGYGC